MMTIKNDVNDTNANQLYGRYIELCDMELAIESKQLTSLDDVLEATIKRKNYLRKQLKEYGFFSNDQTDEGHNDVIEGEEIADEEMADNLSRAEVAGVDSTVNKEPQICIFCDNKMDISTGQCLTCDKADRIKLIALLALIVGMIAIAYYVAIGGEDSSVNTARHSSKTTGSNIIANGANSNKNLPPPFASPIRYFGMSLINASNIIGARPNDAGNIIFENSDAKMLVSKSGTSAISYIDIEFKKWEPCYTQKEFDSKPFLVALNVYSEELEFARKQTHYHTYYDHKNKLKIAVACLDDGAPYAVLFSKKYYLD